MILNILNILFIIGLILIIKDILIYILNFINRIKAYNNIKKYIINKYFKLINIPFFINDKQAFIEVKNWLEEMNISKYKIRRDLSVNVFEDVSLYKKNLKIIPIQFYKVNGNFNCSYNELKSLKGAPKIIMGNFNCSYNKLESLEFLPDIINISFFSNYRNKKKPSI